MKRSVSLVLVLYISCFVPSSFSKTFSYDELYNELIRQGFPHHEMKDWMCLIEGESSRRTDVIGRLNADGSWDYGLFQINDRYWCSPDGPGKGCNVQCNQLLSDDITAAARCARIIYNVHGFDAWVAWKNKCR